jgi:serine/threonine protein kinase
MGLKLVVEDSNHEPDKPAAQTQTAAAAKPTTKKKRRPMGLKLIVEDSNHEPESPKSTGSGNSGGGGRGGGLSINVDDSNGDANDGRRLSDGRSAAYSEDNYGLSESGAFNAAGFLIKETGIAMAPGRDGSGNSEFVGNGFGRASESKDGGGGGGSGGSGGSGGAGGKSSDDAGNNNHHHPDGEHMTAQDELLRLCVLGKGASGIVYKAVHVPTLRLVAIKKIAVFDEDKRNQMVRELKALYTNLVPIIGAGSSTARGSIREGPCPYIVAFHDAFITPSEGNVSIVLEYMDGGSLQDIVDTGGCNLESVLANISYRFLLGIHFIHEHHQLHRDIKPSNLLINHHGAVKISDFGIVREMESTMAKASTFVGTLTYMSPERISGQEYSYASDVWSFGLSLLTVAIGRYPLQTDGGYWGLLHSLKDEPSPELPEDEFSDVFREFIDLCLQKDPKARPSAKDLLEHPFLYGCEEQLEQQERDRRSQRARQLGEDDDAGRDGGEEEEEEDADFGSETARSELDEICELVMDLKYQRWKARRDRGARNTPARFPRIGRAQLAALADQLGLRLRNVARRFERKYQAVLAADGEGAGGGSSRRK